MKRALITGLAHPGNYASRDLEEQIWRSPFRN
jgi:hypothetical protein